MTHQLHISGAVKRLSATRQLYSFLPKWVLSMSPIRLLLLGRCFQNVQIKCSHTTRGKERIITIVRITKVHLSGLFAHADIKRSSSMIAKHLANPTSVHMRLTYWWSCNNRHIGSTPANETAKRHPRGKAVHVMN